MARRWSNNKVYTLSEYLCFMLVSIVDDTSQMSDGGKKDTTYIMDQFQSKVNEIDQDQK